MFCEEIVQKVWIKTISYLSTETDRVSNICISSEALRIGLTIIFCKIEIVIDKTIIYLKMFKHVQILETFNLLGVFL